MTSHPLMVIHPSPQHPSIVTQMGHVYRGSFQLPHPFHLPSLGSPRIWPAPTLTLLIYTRCFSFPSASTWFSASWTSCISGVFLCLDFRKGSVCVSVHKRLVVRVYYMKAEHFLVEKLFLVDVLVLLFKKTTVGLRFFFSSEHQYQWCIWMMYLEMYLNIYWCTNIYSDTSPSKLSPHHPKKIAELKWGVA